MEKLKLKVLPAFWGDSILVSFGEEDDIKNILIDGGIGRAYDRVLKNELEEIKSKGQSIDLLVITHIDDDHIGGIIKLFEDTELDKSIIKKVWFNSGKLIYNHFNCVGVEDTLCQISSDDSTKCSVRQGITLEGELEKLGCWDESLILKDKEYTFAGAKIKILSPHLSGLEKLSKKWEKEEDKGVKSAGKQSDYDEDIDLLVKKKFVKDRSVPNESSIAFIFKYCNKSILFLGDSHAPEVVGALESEYSKDNPLKVDYVKVAHHGSRKNTSGELLELIECNNYIISTDGQSHGLPDKECLARIIKNNHPNKTSIFFNYDEIPGSIFKEADRRYNFAVRLLSENDYDIEVI